MLFSNGEKLILFMLSELFEHLKVKSEIDPGLIKDAISHAQEWGLKAEYEGILHRDSIDKEIVDETGRILSMWRVITGSYAKLTKAQKKTLSDRGLAADDFEFPGFDGNNDRHYGVASFYIDKLGRFEELKGKRLNSHSSFSLPKYRSMLPVYEAEANHLSIGGLNVEQLAKIMDA